MGATAAEEAQSYYRLTEKTYQALDSRGTDFMNLGLWPAPDLRSAQRALYLFVLEKLKAAMGAEPHSVLELGSGWGAGRGVVLEVFPEAAYCGLNSSATQVHHSAKLYASDSKTIFRVGLFEEIISHTLGGFDAAFAIEAMLHVREKESVLKSLVQLGVKNLVLAEICTSNPEMVLRNPLFNPSLKYLFSEDAYRQTLHKCGFNTVAFTDLGSRIFRPWSTALEQIDSRAFKGHPRVLAQFKNSYSALADLAEEGFVTYAVISASISPGRDV